MRLNPAIRPAARPTRNAPAPRNALVLIASLALTCVFAISIATDARADEAEIEERARGIRPTPDNFNELRFSPHARQTLELASPESRLRAGLFDDTPIFTPNSRDFKASATGPIIRDGQTVYGYYPYFGRDISNINWDLLTHVAWFGIEIDSSGELSKNYGWPATEFVDAAHAAGVKVDLAVILFSGTGIYNLVSSSANRARAITTLINEMKSGNADGIAIDFEGLKSGTRDFFTLFIQELRDALDAERPGYNISIAAPAVDWNNNFDVAKLLPEINQFFIMGYDYNGGFSGSAIGPSAVLRTWGEWLVSFTIERSVARYATAAGSAANRKKIVLGVPYYGNRWELTNPNDSIPASGGTHKGSVVYRAFAADIAAGTRTRLYDSDVMSTYFDYTSGGTRNQTWVDDAKSLEEKYRIAVEQGLGGVGIWALTYDSPTYPLDSAIENWFVDTPPTPIGARDNPIDITVTPFNDARDTSDIKKGGDYFNTYACGTQNEWGREFVYRLTVCTGGTLSATVTDGASVDIDIHLLSAAAESACIARNDKSVTADLEPGTYYLVADTFVSGTTWLAFPGPYTLDVAFTGTLCEPDETTGTTDDDDDAVGNDDDAAGNDDDAVGNDDDVVGNDDDAVSDDDDAVGDDDDAVGDDDDAVSDDDDAVGDDDDAVSDDDDAVGTGDAGTGGAGTADVGDDTGDDSGNDIFSDVFEDVFGDVFGGDDDDATSPSVGDTAETATGDDEGCAARSTGHVRGSTGGATTGDATTGGTPRDLPFSLTLFTLLPFTLSRRSATRRGVRKACEQQKLPV